MSAFRTGHLTLAASVALLGCGGDGAPSTRGGPVAGDGGLAARGLPSIVLVSIDSLRADALGCGGSARDTSPFLDELAARGVRFANAISTTSWTLPAHAALFTGLWDSTHGLVDNGQQLADEHLTLAELLRGLGYETAGFYGGPYLHPTFGLSQGFEHWTSCMSSETDAQGARREARSPRSVAHADVTGPRTRAAVARWAAGARTPFFLFVHLWDVHFDYLPPPEYVERFDPGYEGPVDGHDVMGPLVRADSPARDIAHLRALYDAEVRFTDDVLRGICGDLEARGLLANTFVIVAADHGEEFFEHQGKGHQRTLYDEVVRVPLIVAGPGVVAGRVVAEQVRLIDLFPTIAGLVGMQEPLAVQGRDLGPFLRGEGGVGADALLEILVDARRVRGLRTARNTKILYGEKTGEGELYDLEIDRGELHPRRAGAPGWEPALEALRRSTASAKRFGELLGARPAGVAHVPEDVLRRLRELGYLGDGHGD
jgi:arylsulfatase A-like enzyme